MKKVLFSDESYEVIRRHLTDSIDTNRYILMEARHHKMGRVIDSCLEKDRELMKAMGELVNNIDNS